MKIRKKLNNNQITFKRENISSFKLPINFYLKKISYSSISNISLKTFSTLFPESIDSNGSFRKR